MPAGTTVAGGSFVTGTSHSPAAVGPPGPSCKSFERCRSLRFAGSRGGDGSSRGRRAPPSRLLSVFPSEGRSPEGTQPAFHGGGLSRSPPPTFLLPQEPGSCTRTSPPGSAGSRGGPRGKAPREPAVTGPEPPPGSLPAAPGLSAPSGMARLLRPVPCTQLAPGRLPGPCPLTVVGATVPLRLPSRCYLGPQPGDPLPESGKKLHGLRWARCPALVRPAGRRGSRGPQRGPCGEGWVGCTFSEERVQAGQEGTGTPRATLQGHFVLLVSFPSKEARLLLRA